MSARASSPRARAFGRGAPLALAVGCALVPLCSCDRRPSPSPNQRIAGLQLKERIADAGKYEGRGLGRLLLRSSAPDTGDLLLRAFDDIETTYLDRHLAVPTTRAGLGNVIYRFTLGAERFEELDVDRWESATGPICECEKYVFSKEFPAGGAAQSGPTSRRVSFPQHGAYFVRGALSPSGRFGVAVSADGPLRGMRFGFLGGERPEGQHYQEIFRAADGARVGEATALPSTIVGKLITPCWSWDDRFIVYADSSGYLCWIAETGLGEGN